jgi:alpha-amylase/alpha-mannosidase (GH57 family)
MATLSFLWHLHQPCYRTADGIAHAPWPIIHAGGSYRTLASAIAATGGRGQVVNIVPTLLEQLVAYRDGTVDDPILEALTTPASDLDDGQRRLLVEWAFHVTPRQMQRYPRLAELARRRSLPRKSRTAAAFGPGDLRDLQVLFVLAQAGEQAWRDPRVQPLFTQGRSFSPADHRTVVDWLSLQAHELIRLWREIAELPGVEISTSPFAHPIMPLLADSSIVKESWAPSPAPEVPPFSYPGDAAWQLESGRTFMANQGLPTVGCWPPEGSVSTQALAIYADADVRWLVTDEGILERSLGHALRQGERTSTELYRPWTLSTSSPVLFFRDRALSDAIGFRFGRWDDEVRAAHALVAELKTLAGNLPDDASIVLALDGENPWLHYPDGGGRFLRALFNDLNELDDHLRPEVLANIAERNEAGVLEKLHPGSWINGTFATWIGHPEKTAGWRLLSSVRDAIARRGGDRPQSLLFAEASDWFWWLGDDNPTELAPLYDRIYRRHLRDACRQAGIDPPDELEQPLKTKQTPVEVPVSLGWRPPRLDGRMTTYFEWCLATRLEFDDPVVRALSLWGGRDRLHLLIEGGSPMIDTLDTTPLELSLQPEQGETCDVLIDTGCGEDDAASWAVGRVVELSLHWDSRRPARLALRCGDRSIPDESTLLLQPRHLDETASPTAGG